MKAFATVRSPSRRPKQSDARHYSNPAVDSPPGLARHEAAGQHIDALKEPNDANQNQQAAQYATSDSHFGTSNGREYNNGDVDPG